MRLRILFIVGAILLYTPPSFADWLEASSEHFVIYADDSERDLRNFSEKLERYHQAMTVLFPSQRGTPSPSNRPTIYVTSRSKIRKIFGDGASATVGGFYIPRAGASVAFIMPINASARGEPSESEAILMTSYAQHVRAETLNFATPAWFNRGFAEYFASSSFESNGDIMLGMPNNRLAYQFRGGVEKIDIDELLDSAFYQSHSGELANSDFIGRSWALFHYLYSNQAGTDKMLDYLRRLNSGENELDAARAAFGDLEALDREIDRYVKNAMLARRVPSERLSFAPVTIRKLSRSEEATVDLRMQLDRGPNTSDVRALAENLAQDARELAKKYPDE
ncbi:MAG: DUF1570 domain-containing protein, partial [Pseudomonadales bacterium]|nr:DUF1570 domain-containing protein [Pseudomonadales bacterium]